MSLVERTSIRAVLVTPARELLLMRVRSPDTNQPFWITPGGGTSAEETHEACLRRELLEELGLARFDLGAALWIREHTFSWAGQRVHQCEHFYAVHLERFEPAMSDEVERTTLEEFRWWSLEALHASEETFAPRALATLFARYLREGAPASPFDAGR